MKLWIVFIITPPIVIVFLEVIAAVIVGGFMQKDPGSFWDIITTLFIYFVAGTTIYNLAPAKKLASSVVYLIIFGAIFIYLAYTTNGNEFVLFGEVVQNKLRILPEIARYVGLFFGIFGSHQAEKDEQK